jgi:hypothetical protein
MRTWALLAPACLLFSCARETNVALPRARAAYETVASTATARLAAVPLHAAKAALGLAEVEERRAPGDARAVDLAQLAEGKVKIAALRARIEAALRLEELVDRALVLGARQRALLDDLERERQQAEMALRSLRAAEAAIENAKRELSAHREGSSSSERRSRPPAR